MRWNGIEQVSAGYTLTGADVTMVGIADGGAERLMNLGAA